MSVILKETTYHDLKNNKPNMAILPWGATEAHNQHLPHGSDVMEGEMIAAECAKRAAEQGAKCTVLPVIPFGNNAQHLDQICTIHLSTATAYVILKDVIISLTSQGIDKLLLFNSHGGNNFTPLVRDLMREFDIFIVVVNILELMGDKGVDIFDNIDDHAGEIETSLMMHLRPDLVQMQHAGDGARKPYQIDGLGQPGVWTPRPWTAVHPDLGSGNPAKATAEKGRLFFEEICESVVKVIVGMSKAEKGDVPYVKKF